MGQRCDGGSEVPTGTWAGKAVNPAANTAPGWGDGRAAQGWGKDPGAGQKSLSLSQWGAVVDVKVPTLRTQKEVIDTNWNLDGQLQLSLHGTYKDTGTLLSSGWFVRHPPCLYGEIWRTVHNTLLTRPVEIFGLPLLACSLTHICSTASKPKHKILSDTKKRLLIN